VRRVLAFDTATEHIAIGIGEMHTGQGGLRVVAERDFAARRAALGALLPAVRDLLGDVGLRVGDIDIVAVGRGPGSFTGVRIAVATAKGLAQGLGAPLVGCSTLDAVAWRFSGHEGLLAVIGDAMRGEVYPTLFRCSGGICERLASDRVERPSVTAERWASEIDEPVLLTGNGLTKHLDVFTEALGARATVAEECMWAPTGASLLSAVEHDDGPDTLGAIVGLDPVSAAEKASPGALLPVYTRLSDAEEAEHRRGGHVPSSGVVGSDGGER